MRLKISSAILSAAVGLVLLFHTGASGAQFILATGDDADVTEDGLHRVHPSIMEAAWVKPDLDLSGYTRVLLVPTAVQFRSVRARSTDARTRAMTEEFPVEENRQEWMRERWRAAVEAKFAPDRASEQFEGVDGVLVAQGFIVDVVSRIPPHEVVGSNVTYVNDPWSLSVVLELRDAASAELLARTIDRRNVTGIVEIGEVWHQTEILLDRWAQVLSDRLDTLSELGGRDSTTPEWWPQ